MISAYQTRYFQTTSYVKSLSISSNLSLSLTTRSHQITCPLAAILIDTIINNLYHLQSINDTYDSTKHNSIIGHITYIKFELNQLIPLELSKVSSYVSRLVLIHVNHWADHTSDLPHYRYIVTGPSFDTLNITSKHRSTPISSQFTTVSTLMTLIFSYLFIMHTTVNS